ncbi:MAG: polysaccharide biosynthesis protein, partial [Flavitalea sp.]
MSGIKKLAGQTLWYGVPRIFGRFLNFGITLLGFRLYDPAASSFYTQIFAYIPFLTILYTYGLETSYFRFAQTHDKKVLYNTLNVSIITSTILFTALFFLFKDSLVNLMV